MLHCICNTVVSLIQETWSLCQFIFLSPSNTLLIIDYNVFGNIYQFSGEKNKLVFYIYILFMFLLLPEIQTFRYFM